MTSTPRAVRPSVTASASAGELSRMSWPMHHGVLAFGQHDRVGKGRADGARHVVGEVLTHHSAHVVGLDEAAQVW